MTNAKRAKGFGCAALLLVQACAADPCAHPVDAGGERDAGVPFDADAARPADAGALDGPACSAITPRRFFVHSGWLAVDAADTRDCSQLGWVRVFRHGETTPIAEEYGGCSPTIPPLPPGDYDFTAELDDRRWVLGAALFRPESCPPGVLPTPVHCPPLTFRLSPCQDRVVDLALHCDPTFGACPDGAWPWSDAAP